MCTNRCKTLSFDSMFLQGGELKRPLPILLLIGRALMISKKKHFFSEEWTKDGMKKSMES